MADQATSPAVAALAERVRAGDPRAIARAISLIEDDEPQAAALVRALFPATGRAYLVGITGPPGAGKSTLVDRLTLELRRRGETVGIIAVDPTSPYTGGAILGDRVRMQAHAGDEGVFIRSMATRGHLGGLARATHEAAYVLDAAGKDWVVIETVGVGQDEVDIVRTADVSIVTLVPGTGDEVQALKAGIMEIADIFVVNKADREGADRLVASIEAMLALEDFEPDAWRPPVVRTQATTGRACPTCWRPSTRSGCAPRRHSASGGACGTSSGCASCSPATSWITWIAACWRRASSTTCWSKIADRDLDPYTAASGILARALGRDGRQ